MKPQCPNLYWWRVNGGLNYYARPVLLQPGPEEPDVPDLIRPGDWFVAEYRQSPPSEGLVIEVAGPYWEEVAGEKVRWWVIFFADRRMLKRERRPKAWCIVYGVVAYKGELRGLFEADTLIQVRVVPTPKDVELPKWVLAQIRTPRQLTLF